MLLKFAASGHPTFRATTPLSRGQLKSKGKGKTVDTIYRITLSVNQLSIYGAVAAMCDEFEDHQDRTGELVILMGKCAFRKVRRDDSRWIWETWNSESPRTGLFRKISSWAVTQQNL